MIQPAAGSSFRQAFLVSLLGVAVPVPLCAGPGAVSPPASASASPEPGLFSPQPLVEAFQKGPITLTASVARLHPGGGEAHLPLFQVPLLQFGDHLELAFAGEAFDRRISSADWSLVVVFLPRTIAPTEQGLAAYRLKRKGDLMVAPPIPVPYDSIPLLFLVPDQGGRKKILADLTAHLEPFRNLCGKLAELAEARMVADRFLRDLEAIDKTLAPLAYDKAVQDFLSQQDSQVANDLQGFFGKGASNLDKFQFLSSRFRQSQLLVPEGASAAPVTVDAKLALGEGKAGSAYVSILFDLAAIVRNLWPGHKYQYLPALVRNIADFNAELFYSDWVRTTGEVRGAILFGPCQWEAQEPPAFELEWPAGESLLHKQVLVKVRSKDKGRGPFGRFGQGWKLLVTGPQGEALAPLTLTPAPGRQGFVAATGPLQEALRKLGPARVKVRIVGNWGFTSVGSEALELPLGCAPDWTPSPEELAGFQVGKGCALALPAAWARCVEKVLFRPGVGPELTAELKDVEGGGRLALFKPSAVEAGPGQLEIRVFGQERPSLTLPLRLLALPPETSVVEVHQGDAALWLRGKGLEGILAVQLGQRRFLPLPTLDPACVAFRAEDGQLFEGTRGTLLGGELLLRDGRRHPLAGVPLLAPRPRLTEVRVSPAENRSGALALAAVLPIAPTAFPSQVSLVTDKGYRFPADRAFQVAFRNAEEPGEIRLVPAARIRFTGNNRQALVSLNPLELLGGRASGQLEVQVQDPRGGASDWSPLPVTFVDLPTLRALRLLVGGAYQLTGPGLDPIEAVATAPGGPWEKLTIQLEGGQETALLPAPGPDGRYWLRLFGWPDLVLSLQVPPNRVPDSGLIAGAPDR